MSYRSFDKVWQDLQQLKGKTVFTLVHRVRNDIVDFDSRGMLRRSARTGNIKHVDKSAFERVWRKLAGNGYCQIEDGWKIVCACIAHLPEVEYSLNPGTIWLSGNKHDFCKQVERKSST